MLGRKVQVLALPGGARQIPSVLSFGRDGQMLLGYAARERIATDPAHTIASPKRLLGRPFSDTEVQAFAGQVAYRTAAGPDGTTVVEFHGSTYAVTQLCSYLLSDVRDLAERALGCPVKRAVLAAPISFDEQRVACLSRAAAMAGIEVAAIIDEPSAAALANRFQPDFDGVVGIYDFGGGTFDFSIVDVSAGDFRVLATAGDTWLGGDDFDRVLADAAANQFWSQHKVDLRHQAVEWQKLVFACERAKRDLSSHETTELHVPDVLRTADGMVDLRFTVSRPTLNRAAIALIERSLTTCNKALSLVSMNPGDLHAVYLSGGTTYIPAVRNAVAQYFGVPIRTGVPPEHAVCLGAAVHAAQLQFHRAPTLAPRPATG